MQWNKQTTYLINAYLFYNQKEKVFVSFCHQSNIYNKLAPEKDFLYYYYPWKYKWGSQNLGAKADSSYKRTRALSRRVLSELTCICLEKSVFSEWCDPERVFKWFDKWPKLFNLFRLRSVGIWAIVLERKYIGNMFPIGISQYLLNMCSEPLLMNLNIRVLWFASMKEKLMSLFYKPFDRCIEPWHRVFCFGHFWWGKPFYSLYKACFEFDPHVINWHVTVVFRKLQLFKFGHVVFKAAMSACL